MIRSARAADVAAVAVFSELDERVPFVTEADEISREPAPTPG